jgi:hypothetical protein
MPGIGHCARYILASQDMLDSFSTPRPLHLDLPPLSLAEAGAPTSPHCALWRPQNGVRQETSHFKGEAPVSPHFTEPEPPAQEEDMRTAGKEADKEIFPAKQEAGWSPGAELPEEWEGGHLAHVLDLAARLS